MKKLLVIILAFCVMLTMNACMFLFLGEERGNETESAPEEKVDGNGTTEESVNAGPYKITYSSVKTYKNSIGTVWAQVIVEIENTDTANLYLGLGTCDLEDADGKIVASKDISVYPQIIAPGEKAYYYDEYMMDSLTEPIELNVILRPEIVESETEHIIYPVTEISIVDDRFGGIKVVGRVENTSDSEDSLIYVAITLFDENAEPIGVVFTILTNDIAAGEKVGFEAHSFAMPESITADIVASYSAVAYPYQFQFDFS